MLPDDRTTRLLLTMREAITPGSDPTFDYRGLVASIAASERVSESEARGLISAWLSGRGRIIDDDPASPFVTVDESAWQELVQQHG